MYVYIKNLRSVLNKFLFFIFLLLFIYLFMAALGLRCCRASFL